MILLWGPCNDGALCAVQAALIDIAAPLFLLDQRRAGETEIKLDLDGGGKLRGEIRLAGERCDLAAVTAIYVRCHASREVTPGAAGDTDLAHHADHLDSLMWSFLELTTARIVNPASAMATNGSKPYQASIIAGQGFAIPDTLVTTDTEAVDAFVARHGSVIYKSVSGIRSIVQRLRPDDTARLADIAWCPTQFQQYIPGRDYRVHVVGDAVFATEIVSDAADYRYAGREGESVTLAASRIPAFLEDRCRLLAATLGMVFAGIDLRLTPQGTWYCFEVNPSPGFTYYESDTGQPIARAVAALLATSPPARQ